MQQDINEVRAIYRRQAGLDPIPAVLGDSLGNVTDTINPSSGLVWIREKSSNGLSNPKLVRGPYAGAGVTLRPGVAVLLKVDTDGQLYVASLDFGGTVASGGDPNAGAREDSFVKQQGIITALVIPTNPVSLSVKVLAWPITVSNTAYIFAGATVDLTSFVPSAGNHCYAMIFVKSDYATTEVKASTAQSMLDPLDTTDIQECLTAKTAGSIPVWAVRLQNGQTTITDDDVKVNGLDMRQFINVNDNASATLYYQTVQDNGTPKTQRAALNFIGATVADDAGNGRTNITITGSSDDTAIYIGVSW